VSEVTAWFRLRRLPGRLGAVGVLRLLVFQVVQVGVFLVLLRGIWAAVLGSVVGAVAIAVTFGRWRGRWLTDQAVLWLRYRRGRGATSGAPDDPRLVALGQLVPDLVVEDIAAGPEGSRLGMGSDGAGWFTVLEVEPAGAGVAPPVPLAALVRVAAEAGQAGVVIQVVTHTVPVPGGVAARQRLLWVAVRLDADLVADAAVDDLGAEPAHQVDVPAVLAELTRRVRRALRRRGLGARGLDADGVVDALALSCDLAATDAPGLGKVREDWHAWHSPRLAHRCGWLQTWPDPDRGTTLLAGLGESPEARVSISLVLQPRDELESDLRCLIRLAAPPDRIGQVYDRADRLTRQLGGALFPLDGEHALGVYGSAPSGGGAR
jgi:type VII secretion protein EccE